jgi:Ca2+-binding EF-hand superfamily protein
VIPSLPLLLISLIFPPSIIIYNISYLQADVDGNGTIDYIEFITATMHLNRMEREDHLYKAFEYFDNDKSG